MYILPQELRSELKEPLGKLYRSLSDVRVDEESFLITVGDVTTSNALKHGLKPDISIIDNRIQRRASDQDLKDTAEVIRAENPPGTVTRSLWSSIETAIRESSSSGKRFMIIVDGEEDLAVLPSILLAPPGTTVLYGQPNEGVVLVKADETFRRAEELIKKFEEA